MYKFAFSGLGFAFKDKPNTGRGSGVKSTTEPQYACWLECFMFYKALRLTNSKDLGAARGTGTLCGRPSVLKCYLLWVANFTAGTTFYTICLWHFTSPLKGFNTNIRIRHNLSSGFGHVLASIYEYNSKQLW